jgi:hypothetical protein
MPSPQSRTLLYSQRKLDSMVYQCWKYEFEDVIAEIDSVEMVAPSARAEDRFSRLGRRALDTSRRRLRLPVGSSFKETVVERDYELFFAPFLFPTEAGNLANLKGWRERSKLAACFLGELWTLDAELLRIYAPILRQFDHLFSHVGASLPLLQSIVGKPCHLLPVGVDAIRFCPLPAPPARVVDCYSFGRRIPAIHTALLGLADRRPFFYVYDTVNNFSVNDSAQHRRMVAEMSKRSRYLIAYKHNVGVGKLTGGDEALGSRYYEGMAGGAVLLGIAPSCPEFDLNFDWPDAVVELPVDTADVERFLSELDAQPERLRRARRANVIGILRRHDWSHRWATILETMGLPALEGFQGRKRRLAELTDLADKLPSFGE